VEDKCTGDKPLAAIGSIDVSEEVPEVAGKCNTSDEIRSSYTSLNFQGSEVVRCLGSRRCFVIAFQYGLSRPIMVAHLVERSSEMKRKANKAKFPF